jgi:hypothetical protein
MEEVLMIYNFRLRNIRSSSDAWAYLTIHLNWSIFDWTRTILYPTQAMTVM